MKHLAAFCLVATLAGCSAPPQPPSAASKIVTYNCPEGKFVGRPSDIVAKANLLDKPKNGQPQINEAATNALGETYYQLVDDTVRVMVNCRSGKMVHVRITEPEWLSEHKGWVDESVLSIDVDPDFAALKPAAKPGEYLVSFDTAEQLNGQTVRFETKRPATCGQGERLGVRGKGLLKLADGREELVEIVPCLDELHVKRSHGGMLTLRPTL